MQKDNCPLRWIEVAYALPTSANIVAQLQTSWELYYRHLDGLSSGSDSFTRLNQFDTMPDSKRYQAELGEARRVPANGLLQRRVARAGRSSKLRDPRLDGDQQERNPLSGRVMLTRLRCGKGLVDVQEEAESLRIGA